MSTLYCGHIPTQPSQKICFHLVQDSGFDAYKYFTGTDKEYLFICNLCKPHLEVLPQTVVEICRECAETIEAEVYWDGIIGSPAILESASPLAFTHRILAIPDFANDPLLDIQPFSAAPESRWMGITLSGALVEITFDEVPYVHSIATIPAAEAGHPYTALHLAPTGDLAVLYTPLGKHGMVVETATGHPSMTLTRDGYRNDVSPFPVAFFVQNGRLLMVYSTKWNRLDIYDPWTGAAVTQRTYVPYVKGERHPQEAVDYFHGHLVVSPTGEWIADDGWIWSPVGNVTTWNLARWLEMNPFEPESGDSKHYLFQRNYFWGGALCWIDDHTLAMWGYGADDEWLIPAVQLFDVRTGREVRWFPGPDIAVAKSTESNDWTQRMIKTQQALTFDTYLFSSSEIKGVQVWDIETGARLHHDPSFSPIRYHRGTKEFLSRLPNGDFQLSRLVEPNNE